MLNFETKYLRTYSIIEFCVVALWRFYFTYEELKHLFVCTEKAVRN